jgi:regulatory protein
LAAHKEKKIIITPQIAIVKMQSWCAYQERSQYEAMQKLRSMALDEEIAGNILANLISDNFLNEERFARAFVRGKFRIKHWGKNKIRIELRSHKVPEALIKLALSEINAEEYAQTITSESKKKIKQTKQTHPIKKYYAILQYLVSRGFESDIVKDELKTQLNTTDDEFGFEE